MNLEDYLLKNGIKCKETVNYLIKNGLITVNGKTVDYPKIPVGGTDKVEIIKDDFNDCPESYWTLKRIDEKLEFIQMGDFVLDIESPDGGFPLYAARKKANVSLLTIRNDMDFLENGCVEIVKKNVFREDMKKVFSSKFDLIILEAGFGLIKTMELMDKLRDLVGSRGKVLIFVKKNGRENVLEVCREMLEKENLQVIDCMEEKRGSYIYAKPF